MKKIIEIEWKFKTKSAWKIRMQHNAKNWVGKKKTGAFSQKVHPGTMSRLRMRFDVLSETTRRCYFPLAMC